MIILPRTYATVPKDLYISNENKSPLNTKKRQESADSHRLLDNECR